MRDSGNQSLVGIMRHVDTKPSDPSSRISLADQREQLGRLEAVLQPNRPRESPNPLGVLNTPAKVTPTAMRTVSSTRSSSVCSNLLGSAAINTASMEKHGIRVSTNSHNRLVDRLLRKKSRFLSQLTEWVEQPVDKTDEEGAIILDDGVQDMIEAILCDFVLDMCRGGCKTTKLRRSVLTNHVCQATTNVVVPDQQSPKASDIDGEVSLQSSLPSIAVTIPDAVHHSQNRRGIDVPPILLALHHVPNLGLQQRNSSTEWHKQRAISIKKVARPDMAAVADSATLVASDFSRSPTRSLPDCVSQGTPLAADGSAQMEQDDFE